MAVKYTIPFANIKDEQFTIHISDSSYQGDPAVLTGGATPAVIEYKQDDFLYSPLRFAGATVTVLGKPDLSGLYSNNYQQNKVNLYKGTNLFFTGFITPESFNAEHNGYDTGIEIECVSALATLEYVKFSTDDEIITLFALIRQAIAASHGDYKSVYFPITFDEGDINALQLISVSTSNFFDEEGEPMTYREILEEICKLYAWTMTEKEGDIYFIDIDYVKKQRASYVKFDASMSAWVMASLDTAKQQVSDAESTGFENTYSVIPSYTKVTIIDSDYEIDGDLLPELDARELGPGLLRRQAAKRDENKDWYTYMKRYYNDAYSDFICYRYQYNASLSKFEPVENVYEPGANLLNFSPDSQYAGCLITYVASFKDADRPNKLNWESIFEIKQYDRARDQKERYLEEYVHWEGHEFAVVKNRKKTKSLIISEDTKLCISFSVCCTDEKDGFKIEGQVKTSGDPVSGNFIEVPIKLKIGSLYYNGGSWQAAETKFMVNVFSNTTKTFSDIWFDVEDTNDFMLNVPDLTGTIIHTGRVLIGNIELTIYLPQIWYAASIRRYYLIKNIKMEAQRPQSDSLSTKQDTLYTNVIGEDYMSEMDDITFKLTTKNNSGLSCSKLIYNNAILDKIHNTCTNSYEKPEIILINRIVSQYRFPKVKLKEETLPDYNPYRLVKLKSIPSKDFIITCETIDYSKNKSQLTLVEVI